MGLEIQGAVNSMIGSVSSVVQQEQANRKKALNIALGAVKGFAMGGPAGAVAGGVSAAAEQAGIDSSAIDQKTGYQQMKNDAADREAVQRSINRNEIAKEMYSNPIQIAEQRAKQHMEQAQDEKRNRGTFLERMTAIHHGGK